MNAPNALGFITCEVIAQVPGGSDESPLIKYGIAGIIILWFMYRDLRQQQKDEKHQEAQDKKFDQLVQSVNSLVRVTAMEVMSREGVQKRSKDETDEIVRSLPRSD